MTVNAVDTWFASLPSTQRPVLDRIRSVIFDAVPDAVEQFKWGRPCYSADNRLFCYLHTSRGHATLGFQHGASLSDPGKRLEGDGKDMRHIKLRSVDDIDEACFRSMLTEATRL